MPIQSQRANEIDAFIKSHNCAKGKQKIVISGEVKLLESYSLPTSLLQYNRENRRFNLEIQEEENKLGRKLNPTDKNDVEKIKGLILLDEGEAKKLKDDFKKIGEQTDVGAISFDGVVINGNRRMAILEQLDDDEPTGKWKNLWVVRLPRDISESDLWKIEAGFQLSKEKVADYGPVNNLLMIKEGKKAGLSDSEIASSMYGWTEKQVTSDLERLSLIDIFLEFFGQPRNYGLIKKFRLHEHFEDIQKGLTDKQKKLGFSKKELLQKLEVVFLFMRATIQKHDFKFTHYDSREICKILLDSSATNVLTDTFDNFKDKIMIPFETLIDNFDKAVDFKKNIEDREKPGKLIEKAITALSGIDRKGKHFKTDIDVKAKLITLHKLVKEMKKDLGIN